MMLLALERLAKHLEIDFLLEQQLISAQQSKEGSLCSVGEPCGASRAYFVCRAVG